ncbi:MULTISPECIES: hypothetical protein [Brucella]|uniref:hypothetical protein n=1 Tax=Brucella TaxID=234 RepID=UPI0014398D6A|nr:MULTISPECIES: hypothetical protein [Brucella]
MSFFPARTVKKLQISGNFSSYRRSAGYDSKIRETQVTEAASGGYWTGDDAVAQKTDRKQFASRYMAPQPSGCICTFVPGHTGQIRLVCHDADIAAPPTCFDHPFPGSHSLSGWLLGVQ